MLLRSPITYHTYRHTRKYGTTNQEPRQEEGLAVERVEDTDTDLESDTFLGSSSFSYST